MPNPSSWALEAIEKTYVQGSAVIRLNGCVPESLQAITEVEKHRWFWKPKVVRMVLIAESHVRTADGDLSRQTKVETLTAFLRRHAELPPKSFVRLIYCLSYGESELLSDDFEYFSNPGTPAFWEIFGRITFRSPQPRRTEGANLSDRLKWKVETLRELYRMGIWLLDASVHAIYLRNGNRLDTEIKEVLHSQWWKGYGESLIQSCGSPKVWVIGRSVYDCLSSQGLRDYECRGWIYQPNAKGVDLNKNWARLMDDCWKLRTHQR